MKQTGSYHCIVLHRYAFSETSWILKCISPELGAVSLIARGARNPKSALFSLCEPLSVYRFFFRFKEGREMHPLSGGDVQQRFERMRSDLEREALAQVLAELILRIYHSGGENPEEIFDLLHSYFRLLDHKSLDAVRSQFVIPRFLHDFCEMLGFGFQLKRCIECGDELSGQLGEWVPAQGGALCLHCRPHHKTIWSTHLLEIIARIEDKKMERISFGDQRRCEDFYLHYLKTQLGHEVHIKSLEHLKSIRKMLGKDSL
jgi:DNA repair protein RecO (recombination protein O)